MQQTQLQIVTTNHKDKKQPFALSLPSNLVSQLPPILQLEIKQLTLRRLSLNDWHIFAIEVLKFINPKFQNQEETQDALDIIKDFAQDCELTADEMLKALVLASKKQLRTQNGKGEWVPVQLLREVDRMKLHEIEQAYIEYKRSDYQYKNAKKQLQEQISKPNKPTPQEEKALNEKAFWEEIERQIAHYQEHNSSYGAVSWLWKGLVKRGLAPSIPAHQKVEMQAQLVKRLSNRKEEKAIRQMIKNIQQETAEVVTLKQEIAFTYFLKQITENQVYREDFFSKKIV